MGVYGPVPDDVPPDIARAIERIREWHPDAKRAAFASHPGAEDDQFQWSLALRGGFGKADVRRLAYQLAKDVQLCFVMWLDEDPDHYKRLLRASAVSGRVEFEDGREEGFEDQ